MVMDAADTPTKYIFIIYIYIYIYINFLLVIQFIRYVSKKYTIAFINDDHMK